MLGGMPREAVKKHASGHDIVPESVERNPESDLVFSALQTIGSNLERNGVFYLHKKWGTVKSYPKNTPFLCNFKYFCMEMYTE